MAFNVRSSVYCTMADFVKYNPEIMDCTFFHYHAKLMLYGLNASTTPITAMGCRQCLPLNVVQLKGKHCRKTHCRNGVVNTFGHFGSTQSICPIDLKYFLSLTKMGNQHNRLTIQLCRYEVKPHFFYRCFKLQRVTELHGFWDFTKTALQEICISGL